MVHAHTFLDLHQHSAADGWGTPLQGLYGASTWHYGTASRCSWNVSSLTNDSLQGWSPANTGFKVQKGQRDATAEATYLGMQFGDDPSISHVANKFMGTGLLRAPLPGKLSRPLLSAMVRGAGGTVQDRAAG